MKEKGQSLVEMTVITPLLILMFIGVIEIGDAIRNYMVLLHGTREAVRFAVRDDFKRLWRDPDTQDLAYTTVYTHFLLATQDLPWGDDINATVHIHRFDIFTGRPCRMQPCLNYAICGTGIPTPQQDLSDDIYIHPGSAITYTRQFGSGNHPTRINHVETVRALAEGSIKINCIRDIRDQVFMPISGDAVIVEAFFDKPQFLGFPLFAWMLDPVPLRAQTTMRLSY